MAASQHSLVDLLHQDPRHVFSFIRDLYSENEAVRRRTESRYNIAADDFPKILRNMRAYGDEVFCSTVFSRFIAANWPRDDPALQNRFKAFLLEFLQTEEELEPLRLHCTCVSQVATPLLLDGNNWPQLVKCVSHWLSSPFPARVKFVCMILLEKLIPVSPNIFSPDVKIITDEIQTLMEQRSVDYTIRSVAVGAAVRLVLYLAPSFYNHCYRLLTGMMSVVKDCLVYDQDIASNVLDKMLILATEKPNFLKLNIASMANDMLLIARGDHLKVKTREVALKFLVTVCEAPGIVLEEGVIKELVEQLLRMLMMGIEDEEDIIEAMDAMGSYLSDLSCYGHDSLRRLSIALGVDVIVENSPDMLPDFFQDAADWKKRYAALTSLALIAPAFSNSKMSGEYLKMSVEKIMQLVADEHPRVRCAAINAIYSFSWFCSPHFQNQWHQRIIPALSNALDDFNNPRVQIHAVVAMGTFSLRCPSIMKPHLEGIMTKCLKLSQEEQTVVAALFFFRSFANSVKDDFNQFYAMVMAHLKSILKTAEANSNFKLVVKTLNCISVVARSVGKSVFSIDANEIVDALAAAQEHNFKLDAKHRLTYLLLQAWRGLCISLGEDFQPYLKDSMPQLIDLAAQKDFFINQDWNGKDKERSLVLKEIVSACETLKCIATQVKGGLPLWIEKVSEKVLPLVNFEFDEQVKIAAISVMPCLLESAANAREYNLLGLANTISTALVTPLEASTTKVQVQTLVALTKCIEIAKTWRPNGIGFVCSISNILSTFFDRKSQLLRNELKDAKDLSVSKVLSACFYKKESELLKNDEKNICTEVRNCLRALTRRFWDNNLILTNFYILNMLEENLIADERRMALNIFIDIAMLGGEHMLREYKKCIPLLLKACKNNKNPHIQQMAACAIGIYVQFGGGTFKDNLQDGFGSLESIIYGENNDLQHRMAKDAAVCAYGKLCFFLREEINSSNMSKYIKLWLSHLPLKCNIDEAKAAHALLCSMIDLPEIKAEDSYISRVVEIMTKVLWNAQNLATKETEGKMLQQLKMFKQRLATYEYEGICQSLPPYLQNALESYLPS